MSRSKVVCQFVSRMRSRVVGRGECIPTHRWGPGRQAEVDDHDQVYLTINADQLGQTLFEIASEFFRNSQNMKDELGEWFSLAEIVVDSGTSPRAPRFPNTLSEAWSRLAGLHKDFSGHLGARNRFSEKSEPLNNCIASIRPGNMVRIESKATAAWGGRQMPVPCGPVEAAYRLPTDQETARRALIPTCPAREVCPAVIPGRTKVRLPRVR